MARDFNENRNVNAILGQATIDKYGKSFAVQYGLDGINVANVTVKPAPLSIEPYLEGDDTITQFAVPINVDTLCDYALASFPNIEEITLFSLTMVTFDETNLLSYLTSLETVYVPQNLLTTYQSTYPNITFDEITEDYTYVIEDTTQDHVLTSAIVTEQLNALTSQQRNAITKLVIASSYTSASAESVAWGYTFGTLLPYLNNNVWYNSVKYDFATRELTGDDELLESDIDNLISGISSDKINGVIQLKFIGFSDMSVALSYDYEDLPNLEYIWLDNVRYELVSGELVNPTYFYPISDLVSEYDARLSQTFYLDYNGTLPSYPNYQLTYYTDINCTTTILPENMVSGNRYYAKCNGMIGVDFANETWEHIKMAYDLGVAQYQLGDTKTITYNNATYTIRICDIGARYDIVNGNGTKNKATFEFVELVGNGQMNTTNTNAGGFASSLMHTTTLPGIYNNLPSDLKAVISQVSVASASDGSASGSGSLSYSDNYLFLASSYEICGTASNNFANSIENTTKYGLYQENSSKAFRKKNNLSGISTNWWLRSPNVSNEQRFCYVRNTDGEEYRINATEYEGIAPFFCI